MIDGFQKVNFWNGYGSIPINTIFNGMNIHLPAILMSTRGIGFWHTAKSFPWELQEKTGCQVRNWQPLAPFSGTGWTKSAGRWCATWKPTGGHIEDRDSLPQRLRSSPHHEAPGGHLSDIVFGSQKNWGFPNRRHSISQSLTSANFGPSTIGFLDENRLMFSSTFMRRPFSRSIKYP